MTESVSINDCTQAERHRRVSANFERLLAEVDDWTASTPVPEWRVADIVDHLVTWFPAFLAAGGIDLHVDSPRREESDERGDSEPDPDWPEIWRAHSAAVQQILDEADEAIDSFTHPMAGTHSLPDAVDRFYTSDVFMHTWDLARAIGRDHGLDQDFAAAMLAGMEPLDEMLRSSGHYGPRRPVSDDADPVDRLMAFVGRDPSW